MNDRHGKDWAMALKMAKIASEMRGDRVCGVVGNTKEHADRLVALTRAAAEYLGVSVAHITFKAIGGDAL